MYETLPKLQPRSSLIYNFLAKIIPLLELILYLFLATLVVLDACAVISLNKKYIVLLTLNVDFENTVTDNTTTVISNCTEDSEGNSKYSSQERYYILGCLLLICQCLGSCLLIWATKVEDRWYAVPWIVLKIVNLANPFVLNVIYYLNLMTMTARNGWIALAHFVIDSAFLYVVWTAMCSWPRRMCDASSMSSDSTPTRDGYDVFASNQSYPRIPTDPIGVRGGRHVVPNLQFRQAS
ncbi:uncharacterized protein [Periplaneta americana]|uniref:uncharacterized protein n=1 Tax=Periplaneta americana TaxID=6978 RepID=UPI0037E77F68